MDDLYIAILIALADAIEAHHIPATAATLDDLIELYAPRLSRARSAAVPTAFKVFWQRCFKNAPDLEYSEEVEQFLKDVIAAVPGMIVAPGLVVENSFSEVSRSRLSSSRD